MSTTAIHHNPTAETINTAPPMNYTPLIIYHRADYDGQMSAAICWHWLIDGRGEVDLLGWDYGDPLPDISDRSVVFMVDISNDLLVPANKDKIIWIDHHRTAIEKYGNAWNGVRIEGVAACRLCWQWFQSGLRKERFPAKQHFIDRTVQEPMAVRMLGEYDVWDKRDHYATILQYGLRANKVQHQELAQYLTEYRAGNGDDTQHLTTWMHHGEIAYAYAITVDEAAMERAYEIMWEGLRFLVLNTALGNSHTFLSRANRTHDALLMWRWDGHRCKVSLYHAPGKEHHDLSVIAKKFGGGGHPGACGFETFYVPAQLQTACNPISS